MALTLLLPAYAIAADQDQTLQRSDRIDIRRLGKVSEDERSVLRVEWTAARLGSDEAAAVRSMLDSLRRMELAVGEISRLILNMPARRSAVAIVTTESPATNSEDKNLFIAAGATAALLGLWWFRRRKPAAYPQARSVAEHPSPPSHSLERASDTVFSIRPDTEPVAHASIQTPIVAIGEPVDGASVVAATASNENIDVETMAPPEHFESEQIAAETPADAGESSSIDSIAVDNGNSIEFAPQAPDSTASAKPDEPSSSNVDSVATVEKVQDTHLEPTLQLAEIMLSMGLEQGAAQTLIEYTEANPRQALHHWLKLLDIYRNSGNQEDFREATERLRQHFNIQAEDWARSTTNNAPTLENFSRLSKHVQAIWTQPRECTAYLRNLLEDNREGSRAGFPRTVAEEIMLLIEIQNKRSEAAQSTGT